jgi:hypothetical protein
MNTVKILTQPTRFGNTELFNWRQQAPKVTRQLEILARRCLQLADQVAAGQIPFLEAVDLAYDAAVWAGLPNAIDKSGLIDVDVITGDDIVQATIAAAFANARRFADTSLGAS